MKLCYLINSYPMVSHSFIRREIVELERQGAEVLRIALRGWNSEIADTADSDERRKTRYILRSLPRAMLASAWLMARHPRGFLRAAREFMHFMRHSDRKILKHVASFVEGCMAAEWITEAACTHIHAHFGTNSAEVALLASAITGIPFSFTVHGPEEFDHPAGLCLPRKIHRAAFVVAISSFGRSQLYRWIDVKDWRKVQVIHCALDREFLDRLIAPWQPSDAFVCVGRLSEQKGQLLLLQAMRLVIDRGRACTVTLAGDGPMRRQIEKMANDLGLSDHLRITGWISGDQVRSEMLAARAVLLPSFAEGLPVVLMEALALRKPVISTTIAGIPELVSDGDSGWLVPAGDVQALANAMSDCLERDAAQLALMGNSGRQRVLENHDIRREVARLLAFFRDAPIRSSGF